jgi:hypothetical protein
VTIRRTSLTAASTAVTAASSSAFVLAKRARPAVLAWPTRRTVKSGLAATSGADRKLQPTTGTDHQSTSFM